MTRHSCSRTLVIEGRETCCCILSAESRETPTSPRLPILLLHGLACSGPVWEPAINQLAHVRGLPDVYAPDLPGYGRSQGPPEALSIDALADWTAHLLTTRDVARFHVAAHSMGCQVALALARRHPQRVASLTLAGPTLGGGVVPFWRYAVGLVCDSLREPVRYQAALIRSTVQMGWKRYWGTVRQMMQDEAPTPSLPPLPCLVMRGEHDTIVSDVMARRLTVMLPAGRFERVAHAAHAVQYSQPTTFVSLCVAFWQCAERDQSEQTTNPSRSHDE